VNGQDRPPNLPTTEAAAGVDLGRMDAAAIAAAMLGPWVPMAAAVEPELPAIARAIDGIAARMLDGGRLILVGAGTSGRLALVQAAEIAPTFGLEAGRVIGVLAGLGTSTDPRNPVATDDATEDDAAAGAAVIAELDAGAGETVVGIAAGGRSPYTVAALEAAARRGSLTVAVTCAHPSPLAGVAAIAIHPVVGPEVLAGSTRLMAGTVTKVVLDILTTGAMARTGHVHGGRMIDVRPSNAKLRDRAIGIVADLTGRADEAARAALESVGWWPRAAVLRLELGLDAAAARARASAHPFLADALAAEGEAAAEGETAADAVGRGPGDGRG
jgi:N-acetylmuramic acid 6-phosphate etherase